MGAAAEGDWKGKGGLGAGRAAPLGTGRGRAPTRVCWGRQGGPRDTGPGAGEGPAFLCAGPGVAVGMELCVPVPTGLAACRQQRRLCSARGAERTRGLTHRAGGTGGVSWLCWVQESTVMWGAMRACGTAQSPPALKAQSWGSGHPGLSWAQTQVSAQPCRRCWYQGCSPSGRATISFLVAVWSSNCPLLPRCHPAA